MTAILVHWDSVEMPKYEDDVKSFRYGRRINPQYLLSIRSRVGPKGDRSATTKYHLRPDFQAGLEHLSSVH